MASECRILLDISSTANGGVLLPRNWIIHCGGYTPILILGFQFQTINPSYIFNIASVFFFTFIIVYLFLYIVVLFLFGCCHFIQHNDVWVPFIPVRWVLQYISKPIYWSTRLTGINGTQTSLCCIKWQHPNKNNTTIYKKR